MFIILGGTGHVGSAVAEALLGQDQAVTIVGRDPAKAERLVRLGARFAKIDIHDADALRRVFRTGRRAFLLNPPAEPAGDTDVEERRTVGAIVSALVGSGLEKVVAESTYGAQPGESLGDLSTLHELEAGLASQSIPAVIQRAAYYFSNWDMGLGTAQKNGVIESFLPADFKLPMVAPADLGRTAARFLVEPEQSTGLHHVEGPEHYSPRDVAQAFGEALGKPVSVAEIPKAQWMQAYKRFGFSDAAARSYARMTETTLSNLEVASDPIRGTTTLRAYVRALVERSAEQAV